MAKDVRRFHLGDLVSVTTGRMVSPDGMAGMERLLRHVDPRGVVPAGEVRRWAERVTVELVTQHPWLWDVEPPAGVDEAALGAWFADMVAAHGEWHDVSAPPVWPISSLAAFAREAGKPKQQPEEQG